MFKQLKSGLVLGLVEYVEPMQAPAKKQADDVVLALLDLSKVEFEMPAAFVAPALKNGQPIALANVPKSLLKAVVNLKKSSGA